ncbi:MAG: 3-hydroxyacyl-CoA dehydrogenase/enoyl-CoA hydratase family protein, partial [Deltaproteobacteria bacterium]|nr:3-hydroxyacyl-CoA dehydrogenase/enoyl-CoA hydratase family protein [Deltaproteobacteria bacterium]
MPYRKWPQGAALFHEMILFGKPVPAATAAEMGIINCLVNDPADLIGAAIEEVHRLQGNISRISNAAVDIPEISIPEKPAAGKQPLSKEAVSIAADTVRKASAADNLETALEIGYGG